MSHRDITKSYSAAKFATKLRRLADAIERNEAFTIMVDGERLYIPASAQFNVEHEREGDSHELEFQLTWPINAVKLDPVTGPGA